MRLRIASCTHTQRVPVSLSARASPGAGEAADYPPPPCARLPYDQPRDHIFGARPFCLPEASHVR